MSYSACHTALDAESPENNKETPHQVRGGSERNILNNTQQFNFKI